MSSTPTALIVDLCGHLHHRNLIIQELLNLCRHDGETLQQDDGNTDSLAFYPVSLVTKYYTAQIQILGTGIENITEDFLKTHHIQAVILAACGDTFDVESITKELNTFHNVESKAFMVIDEHDDHYGHESLRDRLIDFCFEYIVGSDISRLKEILDVTMWSNMDRLSTHKINAGQGVDLVVKDLGPVYSEEQDEDNSTSGFNAETSYTEAMNSDYSINVNSSSEADIGLKNMVETISQIPHNENLGDDEVDFISMISQVKELRNHIQTFSDDERRKAAEEVALKFAAAFNIDKDQ